MLLKIERIILKKISKTNFSIELSEIGKFDGEDYFVRNSDEAKGEFGVTAPKGMYLFTEQGYLMLVKSFTDDLAWEVQKKLASIYFNVYFRMRLEHCSRVRNQILRMKGSDCMSEKEKRVVEKLRDAIPNMTDFQKGYVLGMVESSASKHSEQGEENETHNGREN